MADEGWVKAAMEDDSVAAEFLLHIKNGSRALQNRDPPSLPLDWSIRQRRSKPIVLPPKKSSAIRDSPTTPLSWSQATSHSSGAAAAADNSEETSRPPLKSTDLPRSKINGGTVATPSKRPRKKKTLAELKEDEVLLLNERRLLKKQLLALNISLEKQRTENESLKRMKLDLRAQKEQNRLATDALHNTTHQSSPSSDVVRPTLPTGATVPLPNSCIGVQTKADGNFALPDLNLPAGEDLIPKGLYLAS